MLRTGCSTAVARPIHETGARPLPATHCTRTSELGIPDFVGNRVANSGRQVFRDGGVLDRPSPINPGLLFRASFPGLTGILEASDSAYEVGKNATWPSGGEVSPHRTHPQCCSRRETCSSSPVAAEHLLRASRFAALHACRSAHQQIQYYPLPQHKTHIICICVPATLISKKKKKKKRPGRRCRLGWG